MSRDIKEMQGVKLFGLSFSCEQREYIKTCILYILDFNAQKDFL